MQFYAVQIYLYNFYNPAGVPMLVYIIPFFVIKIQTCNMTSLGTNMTSVAKYTVNLRCNFCVLYSLYLAFSYHLTIILTLFTIFYSYHLINYKYITIY